ncbi:MAG: Zn-ribbon domain-containing OB-fold protein [Gammaproteobacteria bacterium]|jgi:uncharacterized OB-fold protein
MTTDSLPAPPRPEPGLETRPYWEALREHRLVIQRCSGCLRLRHYPRPLCPHCYAFDHDWVTASGRGSVHSWTVCHHPFHPGFKRDVPYTMLTVDLEEGVRLLGRLTDSGTDRLRLGLPVMLDFIDVDDALTLPAFRLLD